MGGVLIRPLLKGMLIIGNESLKQMLSTLLESGTMTTSDVASVLQEREELRRMDVVEIPAIGYSEKRNQHYITVPKRFSKTGKRHPVYGATKEEAKTKYVLEVSLYGNCKINTDEDEDEEIVLTLSQMVDFTLKQYIRGNINNSSYLTYYGYYSNHIKPAKIASIEIDKITSIDLKDFFDFDLKGKCRTIITGCRTILLETFLRAKERGFRSDNPMEYLRINYKSCKTPKKQKQIVNKNELDKISSFIYNVCRIPKYRYTPMYMVIVYSGLRIGEAIALKEKDIDREHRVIKVDRQLCHDVEFDKDYNIKKIVFVEKEPKTETSIRRIPLTKQAEYWLDIMIELNHSAPWYNSEYLFVNRFNRVPSKSTVNTFWDQLLIDIGVPKCTPHKLRKTFITNLLNGGVDLPTVADIAGHKDPTETLKDYFKSDNLSDENIPKTIESMERVFDGHESSMKAPAYLQAML